MRDDLGLFRILFQDGQKEPRQSHGHTSRIDRRLEASSETGSDVKTQGRDQKKPLKQRISRCFADEFDRAIQARMGRKARLAPYIFMPPGIFFMSTLPPALPAPAGACAPMPWTSNESFTLPAFSNSSVTGTLSPCLSGLLRPCSIR